MSLQTFIFSLVLVFSTSSFAVEDSVEKSDAKGPVFFKPVRFLPGVATPKVESECLMLEKLNDSIAKSANDFELEIGFLDGNSTADEGTVVQVEFINVEPNLWRFGAFRPYSSAKYRIEMYEDGKLLNSEERALNSGVALGACDRLEKISMALGRPIVQWTFLNIGNDQSSINIQSIKDPIYLREIARKLYNTADFNEQYLDDAAQKIWSLKDSEDKITVDAIAWLCKYIGLSESGRYRTFFESLKEDLKRGKLKKYVTSTLKKLSNKGAEEKQFVIQSENN